MAINKKLQKNKGFALLLSLIISSIALSIGLSMLQITMKQLTLGTTTKGSEIAFQATNAGMECLRYHRKDFAAGGTVTVSCLGLDVNMTESGGAVVNRYTEKDFNLPVPGGSVCIKMQAMVVQPSSDHTESNIFDTGKDSECKANDTCMYAIVRGHNRSCAEIGGSIFTAQRELTHGF